ncbi:hypothetical protein A6S26_00560 [Nostoc sp. ATCC 43529]|nr:hypothetical protein A6S26_00560 [Nostoc sp. ATCC 43529]
MFIRNFNSTVVGLLTPFPLKEYLNFFNIDAQRLAAGYRKGRKEEAARSWGFPRQLLPFGNAKSEQVGRAAQRIGSR